MNPIAEFSGDPLLCRGMGGHPVRPFSNLPPDGRYNCFDPVCQSIPCDHSPARHHLPHRLRRRPRSEGLHRVLGNQTSWFLGNLHRKLGFHRLRRLLGEDRSQGFAGAACTANDGLPILRQQVPQDGRPVVSRSVYIRRPRRYAPDHRVRYPRRPPSRGGIHRAQIGRTAN